MIISSSPLKIFSYIVYLSSRFMKSENFFSLLLLLVDWSEQFYNILNLNVNEGKIPSNLLYFIPIDPRYFDFEKINLSLKGEFTIDFYNKYFETKNFSRGKSNVASSGA